MERLMSLLALSVIICFTFSSDDAFAKGKDPKVREERKIGREVKEKVEKFKELKAKVKAEKRRGPAKEDKAEKKRKKFCYTLQFGRFQSPTPTFELAATKTFERPFYTCPSNVLSE